MPQSECICQITEGGNCMIQLTVLYGHPQDTAAFDHHYQETHGPLAKKMPGLKGYTVNRPGSLNPQEQSPAYLIAELYFEDLKALQAALQSPEGQAAAEDVQSFATGGATLLVGEVQVYHPVSIG
jgi:uncharacterized protein (TIGR02118 family)